MSIEQQALELFDRVVDLGSSQQRELLHSEPAEVSARVLALLAASRESSFIDQDAGFAARGLLEEVAFGHKSPSSAADVGEARDVAEPGPAEGPQHFGPWRVVGRLGSGGMGRVFLVEREGDGFLLKGALKVLRWELASPALVERFRLERQILASLDHPSIARLLDGGVTEENLPYLVMEVVSGRSIDAFVEARELGVTERLQLFLDVCAAVQSAHSRLVVHRDVKPANVVVTNAGRVMLLDFGVGKILDAGAGEPGESVRSNAAPATPSYAAPEQLTGGDITTSTDVFALGGLLYKLLSGVNAFESSSGGLPLRHPDSEPLAPSRARASDHEGAAVVARRRLQGDLDNIVLKAMRRRPAERYASVGDLMADIRRYLDHWPVEASPTTIRYRAGKFLRRNRTTVAAGGTLVLALLLGTMTTAWQAVRANSEASAAKRTADFLGSLLTDADLAAASAGDHTVRSMIDNARSRLDQELEYEEETRARVRHLLAKAYAGLGEHEIARDLFLAALEESEGLFGAGSEEVAWNQVGLAASYVGVGDQEGMPWLEQALATMTTLYSDPSSQSLEVRRTIAAAFRQAGDLSAAEAELRSCIRDSKQLFGDSHVRVASVMGDLGSTLIESGQTKEGLSLLGSASTLYEASAPSQALAALQLRNSYGRALHQAGQLGEAERQYRTVIQAGEQKLGSEHPALAAWMTNLGRLLMDRAKFKDALEPVRRSVDLLQIRAAPDSMERIAAEINLASLLLETGDLVEAEPLYADAYTKLQQSLGQEHLVPLRAGWLLARLLALKGDSQAAEALFLRLPPGGVPAVIAAGRVDPMLGLGRIYLDLGQLARAREQLELAHQALSDRLQEGDWHLAEVKAELGILAVRSGEGTDLVAAALAELGQRLPDDNWRFSRITQHLSGE